LRGRIEERLIGMQETVHEAVEEAQEVVARDEKSA
jgi:hypothetical protein